MDTIYVPLNQLKYDETGNVRKTAREPSAAFLASIKAKGAIQPLIVRKNGDGYLVTDGGKRLSALQQLAKRSDIAGDQPVRCLLREDSDAAARDVSLTMNFVREDMHPVDEYEAFAKLREDGMTVDEICKSYGVKKADADRILALGALAPGVRAAWREGKIQQDAAEAFTVEPDHARQEAVLKKVGRGANRWAVRSQLIGDQRDTDAHLDFVGKGAYEAAGGSVIEDLFAHRHEEHVLVADKALLKKLVDEKLQAECDKLIKDGWSWAEVDTDNRRYSFDTLEIGGYKPKPADKGRSGCFIALGYNGKLDIKKWCIKGKAKQAGEKAAATKGVAKEKTPPATISNALKQTLGAQLTEATKKALLIESAAGKSPLLEVLGKIVGGQIDGSIYNHTPHSVREKLGAIRDCLTAPTFNAAIAKAFDAEDYFKRAPKAFVLKAIEEAVNRDEARKVAGKTRAEINKFAVTNVGKSGWLPKELRTAHYAGPGGSAAKVAKAAKGRAKKAA